MYNEDLKKRYIDTKESEVVLAPNFLKNTFTKTEPFEEKLNKDVSSWTRKEIEEFYKYIDVSSLESLNLLHSNLSQYTNWCLTETLVPDGQNHFQELDSKALLPCVNTDLLHRSIITWEELVEKVDTIRNYTDRYIFYAMFEGMGGDKFEEITKAKLSDIDDHTIRLCTGRTISVSSKFIEASENAASEAEYITNGKGGSEIANDFTEEDDGLIFRRLKRKLVTTGNVDHNRAQVLSRRFIKAEDAAGISRQMTPKRLMVSGKIHYIKELAKNENVTDMRDFLLINKEVIDYKYPVAALKSVSMFLEKYSKYLV